MYGMNKRRLHAPIDMTNGTVLPQLLRFAVPMMPTGILQLLYNAADLVVVGKCTGDAAAASLAAIPGARDRHIPCRLPYLLPAADKVDARRRFVRASKKFRVSCSP